MASKLEQDQMYVAIIDHPAGQTRSEAMADKAVLKVARAWQTHEKQPVRIETPDGKNRWIVADF